MYKKYFTEQQIKTLGYTIKEKSDGKHYNFRKYGLKNNVGYEDLKQFRLKGNQWFICEKTKRQTKSFEDIALLP